MPVIRHADSRRTETPTAVMTTLASPSQGGAGQAVWRVDMRPGLARTHVDTPEGLPGAALRRRGERGHDRVGGLGAAAVGVADDRHRMIS